MASSNPQDLIFQHQPLTQAMAHLVRGMGSSEAEAQQVARNLVEANLTGHDSHGIGMLPRYVDAYLEGNLKPNASVRTVLDAGALIRLDGQAGFGQVIGQQAMAIGINRARQVGCAIVALGNAHHLGRIGAWAEQCAAEGLISIHFVNVVARPIVAPYGGAKPAFGTNPFTAGVPLPGGRPPFILDFATSRIAQGKTRVAYNKGESLPEGCLIDDQGRDSQNPRWSVVPPWGAILPFGEHKGSGLAALCELLGGALAAGLTGHTDTGQHQRVLNGMFSILVAPQALGGSEAFEQQAQGFVESLRATPVRPGFEQVQMAGDAERAKRAQREREGVPVDGTTWQQILSCGQKLGISPDQVEHSALGT